ncbi:pentapeptide repeat-containing protein [Actinomadura sp. 3N508]|uniref:pentapeptide repeat-containing protein n=1 Tax=Actinomadura sp. 3N508 TaxID=3375153 RepID=UPI00379E4F52
MEQIAGAAPHHRGHIAALLASFVRQQAPWPPSRPLDEIDAERAAHTGGLRDDVGGAMGALTRRSMILPGTGIELEKIDFRGAHLHEKNLSRFCFADANLEGATLTKCDLSHSTLAHANLKGADLTGADLTGADLTGVIGLDRGQAAEPGQAGPQPPIAYRRKLRGVVFDRPGVTCPLVGLRVCSRPSCSGGR